MCLLRFATGALVVEDLEADDLDEQALFHLINLAREENAYVLLTVTVSGGSVPGHNSRSCLAIARSTGDHARATR